MFPALKTVLHRTALWGTAPTIAIVIITLRLLGWLQPIEWMALDQFFRMRPREALDERVVIDWIAF